MARLPNPGKRRCTRVLSDAWRRSRKAGPDTPERFTESRQVAEHERPKLMLLIPQNIGVVPEFWLDGIPMIW